MRVFLLWLGLSLGATALPLSAAETYDLIFKSGSLNGVPADQVLEYRREISVLADTEYGERNSGLVRLSIIEVDTAQLNFHQGDKYRAVGSFPATVGNPIIMYFVETVLRDVAQQAGGSPFYIRNRIKESLVQFAEIEDVSVSLSGNDITVQQITLRPFLGDKNADRMKGYADLTLTFAFSDDVPGWYHSLVAHVAGSPNDTPIYSNRLLLMEVEPAK